MFRRHYYSDVSVPPVMKPGGSEWGGVVGSAAAIHNSRLDILPHSLLI